jgi:hypothetical protein
MSDESNYSAVNTFRAIKAELDCDDATAATLTLAQCVSDPFEVWINWSSDASYELRHAGGDVAEVLKAITKDGAINVQLSSKLASSVMGMMDLSSDGRGSPKPVAKKTAAKKKK